jgi:hypothetical protein
LWRQPEMPVEVCPHPDTALCVTMFARDQCADSTQADASAEHMPGQTMPQIA